MVRKGNLAVFESSNISETKKATPTKIGVHACDINPYLHEFFEPIPINYIYSPCSEKEIWLFLKVAISPKPKKPHQPKLVCMHVTSIPTCMNFLSRFRSITFIVHAQKRKFGCF